MSLKNKVYLPGEPESSVLEMGKHRFGVARLIGSGVCIQGSRCLGLGSGSRLSMGYGCGAHQYASQQESTWEGPQSAADLYENEFQYHKMTSLAAAFFATVTVLPAVINIALSLT